MSFEEIELPDTLHLAYFSGMVIMPHCSCSVVLGGKNAETAKLAYQSSSDIGLVQSTYEKKKIKQGCYGKITNLTYPKKGRTDLVKLNITGIARFVSEQFIKVPRYDHICAYVKYNKFNDLIHKEKKVDFETMNPLFAKYLLTFLFEAGTSPDDMDISDLSFDKFINSLVMIMPMSIDERKMISEMITPQEKETALSTIMQLNEYSLTQTEIAH